ncbi:MAG: murein biosynthesis integral membrane protein MurJ [Bacteriovoracaceae bacterium]
MSQAKNSILKSSMKMGSATLLSRVFGLVREQVMAALFGASNLTDAFLVAYRIPNLLRDLFAEGAFSSAFVPTFTSARLKDHMLAQKLLWSLFIILFAITGGISLFMIYFASELVTIFAPTFVNDPEKFQITVTLTQIMSPFLALVSISALFVGALNSLKIFFIPALAPAVFYIVSIICALVFPDLLLKWGYHPIYALGIGVTVGGIAQGVIQLPKILEVKYGPTKEAISRDSLVSPQTKEVMYKLGPGLLGFAAAQINMLISTILASSTVVGAVSWLSYSFRLFQFPVGILGVSIANANMVHFSEEWQKSNKEAAKKTLKDSYNLSLITIFPMMIIMYFLATPIVNLIFQRGKFNAFDTEMTTLALRLYAIGLPFYGINKILVPCFYVFNRQKIPVISSISAIIFNIIFSILLVPKFGFSVLALGTSLSVFISTLIQSYSLNRQLELGWNFFIDIKIGKMVFSSLITSLFLIFYKTYFCDLNVGFFIKIFQIGVGSGVALLIYIGTLHTLGEKLKKTQTKG